MALNEDLLIWYFWDYLRLYICVQINEYNKNLENWQEMFEKAINTKAKVDRQSYSLI